MYELKRHLYLGFWLLTTMATTVASASPTAFKTFPNNSTHSNASVALAISNVPLNVGTIYDAFGGTNDIQIWNFNTLLYTGSYNIASTLQRIRDGYFMAAESDDGGFFNFSSNELPNIPRKGNNYYMEFTVWPSMNLVAGTYDESVEPFNGMTFPGAMRLLIGLGGEVYFTGDHYGEDGTQTNAYYVNPFPPIPSLKLTRAGANNVIASWPTNTPGFLLQQTTNLNFTGWTAIATNPGITNGLNQILLPVSSTGKFFYRLYAP